MDRNRHCVSEKLLGHIEWQGADPLHMVFGTATGMMHAVNAYSIAAPKVMMTIEEHYREQCWGRVGLEVPRTTIIDLMLWELLLNAAEHGNQWDESKNICIMVWRGDVGIVIGCRDEGAFFKQKEVKEHFENRQRIRATDKEGRGKGTKLIYGHADHIEVDTETGTVLLAVEYF